MGATPLSRGGLSGFGPIGEKIQIISLLTKALASGPATPRAAPQR